MSHELLLWVGFIVFILGLLALDLGVFNRKAHVISTREALGWSAVWISLAMAFVILVYYIYAHHWFGMGLGTNPETGQPEIVLSGKSASIEYLTGYIIEKSLSLDNVMVIALIFTFFRIPLQYQHRVLFWGIMGALVMRGAMIALGTALIRKFDWINYVFGALLLFTAVKLLLAREREVDPERNPFVRLARKLYPYTPNIDGQRFFVQLNGRRTMTPLFLVLIVVETTDVLFAVDSIPAIFAVTRDPFIVFTSNVFAILGLRSLYFALAGMMDRFKYLSMSLVFILAFVGGKLMIVNHYHVPVLVSLVVIGCGLAIGILASVLSTRRRRNGEVGEFVG